MADAETWLLVAACVVGVALYFAVVDIASGRLSRVSKAWARIQARGETMDRLNLRKRWAWEARRARLGHEASSLEATQRWMVLGKRGAYRVVKPRSLANKWQPSSVLASCIAVFLLLLAILAFYLLGALLLFELPYNAGMQSFRAQYLAATGREVPQRHLTSWKLAGRNRSFVNLDDTVVANGRNQLVRYAFVRVTSKALDADEDPLCGWLVQGSGNQLLLLTTEGLVMKNFGDIAFGWKTEVPGGCPSKSGTVPSGKSANGYRIVGGP
jgi:hypothetical protein